MKPLSNKYKYSTIKIGCGKFPPKLHHFNFSSIKVTKIVFDTLTKKKETVIIIIHTEWSSKHSIWFQYIICVKSAT